MSFEGMLLLVAAVCCYKVRFIGSAISYGHGNDHSRNDHTSIETCGDGNNGNEVIRTVLDDARVNHTKK